MQASIRALCISSVLWSISAPFSNRKWTMSAWPSNNPNNKDSHKNSFRGQQSGKTDQTWPQWHKPATILLTHSSVMNNAIHSSRICLSTSTVNTTAPPTVLFHETWQCHYLFLVSFRRFWNLLYCVRGLVHCCWSIAVIHLPKPCKGSTMQYNRHRKETPRKCINVTMLHFMKVL